MSGPPCRWCHLPVGVPPSFCERNPERLCQPATKEEIAEWTRSGVAVRAEPTAVSDKAALVAELRSYGELIKLIEKEIPADYRVLVFTDLLGRRRAKEDAAAAMGGLGAMLEQAARGGKG